MVHSFLLLFYSHAAVACYLYRTALAWLLFKRCLRITHKVFVYIPCYAVLPTLLDEVFAKGRRDCDSADIATSPMDYSNGL